MKIIQLRFKNINSLYGEWTIDFTSPEYIENGLFAITGPTGSGKSSLLDAMCLALYGATPRLGKISKSDNGVMSRQTGECFSEVIFQSKQGAFRCHWSQHRARKKADGKLAEAKHEIVDEKSGKILASKKRDVAIVVEKKTGMDFERFTRSMLLAQGGFSAFLMASADDKAPILEQITGTEIYSQISQLVHERVRQEVDAVKLIQAESSAIQCLTDEQVSSFKQELLENSQAAKQLEQNYQNNETALQWCQTIVRLEKNSKILNDELQLLNTELETFKPQRIELENSLAVMEVEPLYSQVVSNRKLQKNDKEQLRQALEKRGTLDASLASQLETSKETSSQFEQLKITEKELLPIIHQVKILDSLILDKKKTSYDYEVELEKLAIQLKNDNDKLMGLSDNLLSNKQQLQQVQSYLLKHEQDEALTSLLTSIDTQWKQLSVLQQDRVANERECKRVTIEISVIKKTVKHSSDELSQQKKQLNDLVKKRELTQKKQQVLLQHKNVALLRQEKESLLREFVLLEKIADLESEREKLIDGQDCPLCGSKDHPYAKGNQPAENDTQVEIEKLTKLIGQVEKLAAYIHDIELKEKKLLHAVVDAETNAAKKQAEFEAATKVLSREKKSLVQLNERYEASNTSLLNQLSVFHDREVDEDIASIIKSLQLRQKKWNEQQGLLQELQQHENNNQSEHAKLSALINQQQEGFNKVNLSTQTVNEELKALMASRDELFANKSPDKECEQLSKRLLACEEQLHKVIAARDIIQHATAGNQTEITSLENRINQRVKELEQLEQDFSSQLIQLQVANEEQFFSQRQPKVWREKLQQHAKQLDEKLTAVTVKIQTVDNSLGLEREKKLTLENLAALQGTKEKLVELVKNTNEVCSALKHQLRADKKNQQWVKEKRSKILNQEKQQARWQKLHALIGSSDGKKYRNFAQGITFEMMVGHANRQLQKMTDRYLLIRDKQQPLELNVIDNYQAGEVRSSRNLSGGESFIISLALALGLSKLSSQTVSVDSLFLDEGFGTLDEEALETALQSLSELQQSGKIIGIISHVSALKERIPTQILIKPTASGRSVLQGPGCVYTMES